MAGPDIFRSLAEIEVECGVEAVDLGDRLGVCCIVLLALHKWFYVMRRNQLHLMTKPNHLAGPFHVRPLNAEPDRTLAITKGADGVEVDNAKVVAADIVTDNGIVHAIDTVLLPSK